MFLLQSASYISCNFLFLLLAKNCQMFLVTLVDFYHLSLVSVLLNVYPCIFVVDCECIDKWRGKDYCCVISIGNISM